MTNFDPFLSLDCARVEGVGAQSKERKGSNFAVQRSGAIVQKPEGPNTYDLKIRLEPSGNHACKYGADVEGNIGVVWDSIFVAFLYRTALTCY